MLMQFQTLLPPLGFLCIPNISDAALERSRGLSLSPESQLWAGMAAGMSSSAFPITNINVATQIPATQGDSTGLDDTWT